MNKMKKNHGFTLAELLVVIAILAILIAIAVPVFSGMVADANLRVNQANVRSVRSAGVAHILTNLDKNADTLTDVGGDQTNKFNAGLAKDAGWVAIAEVDNNGDIRTLRVLVVDKAEDYANGIYASKSIPTTLSTDKTAGSETGDFFVLSDNTTFPFATVKPKGGSGTDARDTYWVQAVITDLDPTD